jgi:hypothetical protein
MIRYVFDEPLTIKGAKDADPQVLGEALEAVSAAHKGRLTPLGVVDAARDPKSPLHPHFEWDDAVAAEAYRCDQARAIIRAVRVDDAAYSEPQRAFLSVSDRDGVSYRGLLEVSRSVDLQLAVLRSAERDLAGFQRRYHGLKEVCDLVAVAEAKVSEKLREKDRAPA